MNTKQEVRQFTEAGINLYQELANYYKDVKGEAKSTGDIVDMISKRQVSFNDVAAVFQRLTDKGGIFYNMQEIQSETLQGKISNLKDSFDIFLNDIGKSNEGVFKGMVDGAKTPMDNWEKLMGVAKALIGVLILLKTQSMETAISMKSMSVTGFASAGVQTTKALGFFGLLGNGFKKLKTTIVDFSKSLKTAFLNNIWLVAIMALFEVVRSIWQHVSEYNDAIKETNKEHNELTAGLQDLADKYNNVVSAANSASEAEKRNNDNVENIKQKREALASLVETMQKQGLSVSFQC